MDGNEKISGVGRKLYEVLLLVRHDLDGMT